MDKSNGGMGCKTVLITGGTSGIGKAAAVALAAMGANVVIVGRDRERGEAALEEIKAQSHNAYVDLTFKPFMRSPEQGEDTLIWLASSSEVEGVSGKYFSDHKEIEAKSVAYERAARRRLWEISEELTGLKVAA